MDFIWDTAIRSIVSLSGFRASALHVGTMSESSVMYWVILLRRRRSISLWFSLKQKTLGLLVQGAPGNHCPVMHLIRNWFLFKIWTLQITPNSSFFFSFYLFKFILTQFWAIYFGDFYLENLLGPSPSSSSKSILRNNHRKNILGITLLRHGKKVGSPNLGSGPSVWRLHVHLCACVGFLPPTVGETVNLAV